MRLGAVAFGTMFGMILTLVLLFYFLWSGPGMARGLLQLAPPRQRALITHIWTVLDPVLKRYFVGVLVVVAYAAAAAYVGLGLVLGIPHAVPLALLTGFMEMVPVIGPIAAAVIAGLVAIHQAASIGAIIAYALYATALRISIDQLFGPLALGAAARLHPVLIIFCFLSGAFLFGVVGVIMAVPVALAIKVTLALLYDEAPKAALGSK
jgi:predicted PurR-regulated permease PerM